jgi:cytochrome c-type biogenesis protein CcmE
MSKGVQIAVATLSIFAGIAWLLTREGAGEGTFSYYASVTEYVSAPQEASRTPGRGTRVHGFVVAGSIEKNLPEGYVKFAIRDDSGTASLRVRLDSLDIPDLFGDGAEVVVEGTQEGDRFLAHRVLAKCPSKYEVGQESEA